MSDYWMRRIDAHLERVDAHIARGNDLFERNTAAYERNTAAYERNTAAFERWEQQHDEMREFMREITLRVERAGREHSREIRRMRDEIVAELRAGRGALLAILDRLEPGDSGSAA